MEGLSNMEFIKILLAITGSCLTVIGGFLVYFFQKMANSVDSMSVDIGEMKVLMEGHEENLKGQEKRLDRIESRVEKLES